MEEEIYENSILHNLIASNNLRDLRAFLANSSHNEELISRSTSTFEQEEHDEDIPYRLKNARVIDYALRHALALNPGTPVYTYITGLLRSKVVQLTPESYYECSEIRYLIENETEKEAVDWITENTHQFTDEKMYSLANQYYCDIHEGRLLDFAFRHAFEKGKIDLAIKLLGLNPTMDQLLTFYEDAINTTLEEEGFAYTLMLNRAYAIMCNANSSEDQKKKCLSFVKSMIENETVSSAVIKDSVVGFHFIYHNSQKDNIPSNIISSLLVTNNFNLQDEGEHYEQALLITVLVERDNLELGEVLVKSAGLGIDDFLTFLKHINDFIGTGFNDIEVDYQPRKKGLTTIFLAMFNNTTIFNNYTEEEDIDCVLQHLFNYSLTYQLPINTIIEEGNLKNIRSSEYILKGLISSALSLPLSLLYYRENSSDFNDRNDSQMSIEDFRTIIIKNQSSDDYSILPPTPISDEEISLLVEKLNETMPSLRNYLLQELEDLFEEDTENERARWELIEFTKNISKELQAKGVVDETYTRMTFFAKDMDIINILFPDSVTNENSEENVVRSLTKLLTKAVPIILSCIKKEEVKELRGLRDSTINNPLIANKIDYNNEIPLENSNLFRFLSIAEIEKFTEDAFGINLDEGNKTSNASVNNEEALGSSIQQDYDDLSISSIHSFGSFDLPNGINSDSESSPTNEPSEKKRRL
jgi:hypothetical protein